MNLPQVKNQGQLIIRITAGADKGRVVRMSSSRVVLGREPDCELVLQDEKLSRHHAVIERTGSRFLLKDMGSRAGVIVNGKMVQSVELHHGDTIQIAETILKIDLSAFQVAPAPGAAPALRVVPSHQVPSAPRTSRRSKTEQKSPTFYILLVGVVGLFLFLLLSNSKKRQSTEDIRGDTAVQAEIEKIQRRQEILKKEKEDSGVNSRQYLEAQSAYIKGFRDYREANYSRAIQNFTASLALYPQHQLAQKYRRLAERKLDELVQASLFQGRKYMEQTQYDRALSEFRNVLILINDRTNKRYQEAEERINEINLLLKGRY